MLVIITITILLSARSYNKHFRIPLKHETLLIPLSLILMLVVQSLTVASSFKHILEAFAIFGLMFYFANWNVLKLTSILKIAFINSFLGILSVLYLGGFNQLESQTRENSLIDKGALTLWFSLALCFSFANVLLSKKYKLLSLSAFCFILICNLFVIQSKTCILSFILFFVITFFSTSSTIRKYLLLIVIPALMIFIPLAWNYPEYFIPNTFAIAINQVLGKDILPTTVAKGDLTTYEIRDVIDLYCASLFLENPLAGIGLGQYAELRTLPTETTECENMYFDLLVNGGILYGLPVISTLLTSLVMGIKRIRANKENINYYYILGIVCSFLVCFRWNDFFYASVFVAIGVCYYYVRAKDRDYLTKFNC